VRFSVSATESPAAAAYRIAPGFAGAPCLYCRHDCDEAARRLMTRPNCDIVVGVIVQRKGRRMQAPRGPAFRLPPVEHGIHFHRFKFRKIEPEMLCNERA
jgi:hypothetical protein